MIINNQVLFFVQFSPTTDKIDIQVIPTGADWMAPIISHHRNGTLPKDHNASQRLKVQLSHFVLIGDVINKRGFSRLYLRCLVLDEAEHI